MTCVPQLTGHLGLSSRHPVQSQRRQPVQQSCNIDPRLSLVSSLKREREPGIEVGLYCNCDVISQCGYKAAYNNHLDILPSFYKQFWEAFESYSLLKKRTCSVTCDKTITVTLYDDTLYSLAMPHSGYRWTPIYKDCPLMASLCSIMSV